MHRLTEWLGKKAINCKLSDCGNTPGKRMTLTYNLLALQLFSFSKNYDHFYSSLPKISGFPLLVLLKCCLSTMHFLQQHRDSKYGTKSPGRRLKKGECKRITSPWVRWIWFYDWDHNRNTQGAVTCLTAERHIGGQLIFNHFSPLQRPPGGHFNRSHLTTEASERTLCGFVSEVVAGGHTVEALVSRRG